MNLSVETNDDHRLRMGRTQRRRKSGFTLVELLVVIAVIGILMALLLPAINAVVMAARRMQCQSHMKQIGIALVAYHASHDCLPMGELRTGVDGPSYRHQFSWMCYIVPYLEVDQTYDDLNFDLQVNDDANITAASLVIGVFLCPSDREIRPSYDYGPTNYFACLGTNADIHVRYNGCFGANSSISFKDIRDGTSHTILVGEAWKSDGDVDTLSDNYIGTRTSGTDANNIATCQPFAPNASDRGARWVGGQGQHWVVTTHRPPNDPNIDCWAPSYGSFNFAVRSRHSGGANILFADGSVSFAGDSTDTAVFQALGTRDARDIGADRF